MRAILPLLVAAIFIAAPVAGQGDTTSTLLGKSLADYARDEDSSKLIDTVRIGQLKVTHDGVHDFAITPNTQYLVLAIAEDAGEVSLLVTTGEEDGQVWEDFTQDPGPKVEIEEQQRSRISVTVQMDDCGKPACVYALGVYKAGN